MYIFISIAIIYIQCIHILRIALLQVDRKWIYVKLLSINRKWMYVKLLSIVRKPRVPWSTHYPAKANSEAA